MCALYVLLALTRVLLPLPAPSALLALLSLVLAPPQTPALPAMKEPSPPLAPLTAALVRLECEFKQRKY